MVVLKHQIKARSSRRQSLRFESNIQHPSFFGPGHGLLGRFEADLGMSAVAEWLLGRGAAPAKGHARFDWKFVTVRVD
jgi:hypothetical protein